MKTRITELFGIQHPIIQGGMHYRRLRRAGRGGVQRRRPRHHHRPDPAHAGGPGARRSRRCHDDDRQAVRREPDLPAGASTPPDYPGYIEAIIDGGVKIVETAGNNPQK